MREPNVCRGIEYIRTAKSCLHSIPRKQDAYGYLDLYMLDKEKERLEKEMSHAEKRIEIASKRLEEIKLKMKSAEKKSGNRENEEKTKESVPKTSSKKEWRVMPVDY